MDRAEYRRKSIDNLQNKMIIHGFLRAIEFYVLEFGLESTASYIIKKSNFSKDDLIKCQLEVGHEDEKMLEIINNAFK